MCSSDLTVAVRDGLSSGAAIVSCGWPITITGGHTRTAPRGAKGCAGTVWDDRSLVNSLGQLLQLGREERERARIARATPNDSLRAQRGVVRVRPPVPAFVCANAFDPVIGC